MIEGYITVSEMAKKWGVKPRAIQMMCLKGKIYGAQKIGNIWMIHAETDRPVDERVKTGRYIKEKET